jgi:U3 small nucleolar RNA-associated protein 10
LIKLLIHKAVSEDGQTSSRRLLSHIQQRHPLLVQEVADEITRSHVDIQESIDDMVISLSVTTAPQSSEPQGEVGSLVASMGADERVRAAAVKDLLKSLTSQDDAVELVRLLFLMFLLNLRYVRSSLSVQRSWLAFKIRAL